MKKIGFLSMFAAALMLGACSNLGGNEPTPPTDPETPDTPDEPAYVEPAGAGTEADPYNVSKALTMQNDSMAWVKGYIVGHVAGVDIVADSQFDAPFTGQKNDDGSVASIGYNILIAAKATENNHSACLVVQLPKGDLREVLNLVTNPTNDGKEVEVYGKLTKYFGVAGMKETSKAKFDGTVLGEGGETPETPDEPVNPGVGEGSGTKEAPFNVAAAIGANNSGVKAWVKAYIVGQICGKSISDTEFDAPFNLADGSTQGTNVIVADAADEQTTFMPVQLPKGAVRDALNLPENPTLDGKEVLLYGELVKYFGANGIKTVTCAIVDGVVYGTEPTDEPETPADPEGTVIFEESFATSLGVFTADDRSLDPALTYVWSYDERYKCAKASAYNQQAYDAESWLVSPAIALNGKEATLTFDHAANYINNAAEEMRLFYTTDDGANWTELTIPTYATNWTFINAGTITIPAAESVKIAFAYKSTTAGACTWEIQNVKIYQ